MVNNRMSAFRGLALFLAIVVLGPTGAQSQKFQGRQLVEARLLADVASVSPGQPFTAGLLLTMVPGWHSYWQFPGDAGIPTEIKWQLPPGWKAGPIQWPVPLKLDEPGGIQIYGYHDEVLLLVQLTPPPKIDAASVHLAAETSWLGLRKNLHPGRSQGAVGSARRLASHSGEHRAFCEISRTAAASAPGERARHAPLESSA